MTTTSSSTPPKIHSNSSQVATEGASPTVLSARAERGQVHVIRAYFVLGALALVIGIYILLNPELSTSGLSLAQSWLQRFGTSLETLSEFYFFTLALVLIIGGALLLIGGSLVAFVLNKQRQAWRKPAAAE